MPSAVDELVTQIEDEDAPEIALDVVRQKATSLGSDEWSVILMKISSTIRCMSQSPALLDNQQIERLRLFVVILTTLDVSESNFRERDELTESVGLMVNVCPNVKVQKSLMDVLLGWVKKEWVLTSPSLYPLLKFTTAQVRAHKKVGDIKNLAVLSGTAAYAVRCSNDTNFVNELCAIGVNPNVFQNQEGRRFTIKLYEQVPEKMHDQMKAMLSTCDRKLGKALGDLYFRCISSFAGEIKESFLQNCLQDLAYWTLCMPDENLAQTLLEAMVYISKKLKVTKKGSDDLFNIYAPFLMNMTEAPNSTFRNRSSRLLLTAFPLASSESSDEDNEKLESRQLAAFERLLEDNVPAVRATAIAGLCELASCIAEALPVGWLQKVLGKVFVRLAFDTASPDVRLACVKGLGRLVENHVLWPLSERLFSEIKQLLHDKSHLVRIAFAQLLDKIAKLHAFKPWKYLQSRADFLPRLALDDASVCRPLTSLLLDYYLPANKDSVCHLDTCVNLVEFNAVAARNFYRLAVTQLSFVRATAFLEIVLKHLLIKSGRLLSKVEGDDANATFQTTTGGGDGDVSVLDSASLVSAVDNLHKLTEVAAACWLALLPQLKQAHNSACARDLERMAANALPRVFKLCEHFHHDASNVVLFASCLPWRTVPVIFQKTVGFLRRSGSEEESADSMNDAFRKTATVAIKALTNWAKLSELLHIIHESIREGIAALRKKSTANEAPSDESKRRSTRKRVRFDKAKAATNQADQSGATGDLETHLGLLDMLLRNRSCVRQLRGKEPQMREIWEELTSALDLIDNAANSTNETLGEVDRHLLLCFEFYCRVGLLLHVDSAKVPAVVDDSFLKQLTTWLRGHTAIFSGNSAKPLTEFQVSICRIYLKQLTTRLMLNAVTASGPDGNETTLSSAMGPSDVFEMALDATAFIPSVNRVHLAESVIGLVYASIAKLTTINGQLTQMERSEHMRLIVSYLVALDESTAPISPSVLVHSTDCFVLLALLCKKAEKTGNQNAADDERIVECFTRLISIVVKSLNTDELKKDDDEDEAPQEKRRPISKNPQDSSYVFNVVFSRFYPAAVRGIFSPYLPILEKKLPEDGKIRALVSRWLSHIGYNLKELPASFAEALEEVKTTSPPAVAEVPVDENSVDAS